MENNTRIILKDVVEVAIQDQDHNFRKTVFLELDSRVKIEGPGNNFGLSDQIEITKSSQFRAEVYKEIAAVIGVETLSEELREKIRPVLIGYAMKMRPNNDPVTHTYLCGKCGGKKVGAGAGFNKRMKQRYETESNEKTS